MERATDRPRGWGKLTGEQGSLEGQLSGIDLAEEPQARRVLAAGRQSANTCQAAASRTLGDFQRVQRPHSAILFAAQAKRLGVRVGDRC